MKTYTTSTMRFQFHENNNSLVVTITSLEMKNILILFLILVFRALISLSWNWRWFLPHKVALWMIQENEHKEHNIVFGRKKIKVNKKWLLHSFLCDSQSIFLSAHSSQHDSYYLLNYPSHPLSFSVFIYHWIYLEKSLHCSSSIYFNSINLF